MVKLLHEVNNFVSSLSIRETHVFCLSGDPLPKIFVLVALLLKMWCYRLKLLMSLLAYIWGKSQWVSDNQSRLIGPESPGGSHPCGGNRGCFWSFGRIRWAIPLSLISLPPCSWVPQICANHICLNVCLGTYWWVRTSFIRLIYTALLHYSDIQGDSCNYFYRSF